MSQHDHPRNTAPVLHRYDPTQAVTIPARVQAVTLEESPAAAAADSPVADTTTPAPGGKLPADRHTAHLPADRPVEIGGPSGPEPTRYGDWERNGRVSDF